MNIRKSLLITAAACAMAGVSIAGYAAQAPYNPDHLGKAQNARVAQICQNMMGLSPAERESGGNWQGNDRLDYWTSHYRGCILSLSDSQQNITDTLVTQQADEDCRVKGYRSGSPDLALCVVQAANAQPEPTPSQATVAAARPVGARLATAGSYIPASTTPPAPVSEEVPAVGSYFRASPQETERRENVACAALGLEPGTDDFKGCVDGLSDTLYAIDNPIN